MATTVNNRTAASQREELADVRPHPAKADLRPQVAASSIREVAAEAVRRAHGKQETAAGELGIHFASLSRQLSDGSLRLEQMEKLGPVFAVKFAEEVLRQYGELVSPKDYIRRVIREMRERLNEIEQFVEDAA